MMVPFLWMILTSLKTRAEVFAVPPTLVPRVPQWGNYAEMGMRFRSARSL